MVETAHLTSQVARRLLPEPEVNVFDRSEAAKAIREHVVTEYHLCGSCAMGVVVDEWLRVKGVKGLRIVDASVPPITSVATSWQARMRWQRKRQI